MAHIHVQNVGSGFCLRYTLGQDVVEIAVCQRPLEALFAGGVQTLTDDPDPV